MKKITMIMILGIALIGIISAATIGQIITQEQLDSINVSTRDLNFKWNESMQELKQVYDGGKFINRSYSYETIRFRNNTFKIVQINRTLKLNTKEWHELWNQTNKTYTIQKLSEYYDKAEAYIIKHEKKKLRAMQTNNDYDVTELLNEINA